jgi:hypothetical protein
MRNKKTFSFDEEKDAIEIVTNGFPNNSIDYTKMYVVAKYFKRAFGYGEIRLEREVIRFCLAQDKNFNPIVDAPAIKRWVKSAMAYDLRKINSVTISQKEIDFLKTIEIQKERKLLFAVLILAKALKRRGTKRKQENFKVSDKYYIHYNNFLSIIKLAGIKNISEVDLAYILHKYKDQFLFYNAEKELIRIEYIDKGLESGVLIDNLDNVMSHYDMLFGKNIYITNCAKCNKKITKNTNKKKYCSNCAKILEKERKAKWKVENKQIKKGELL